MSIRYSFSKDFQESCVERLVLEGRTEQKWDRSGLAQPRSRGDEIGQQKGYWRMRKDCWAWGQRVSRDRARPPLLESPWPRGPCVFQHHPSITGWEQLYFLLIRFKFTSLLWGWVILWGQKVWRWVSSNSRQPCARRFTLGQVSALWVDCCFSGADFSLDSGFIFLLLFGGFKCTSYLK